MNLPLKGKPKSNLLIVGVVHTPQNLEYVKHLLTSLGEIVKDPKNIEPIDGGGMTEDEVPVLRIGLESDGVDGIRGLQSFRKAGERKGLDPELIDFSYNILKEGKEPFFGHLEEHAHTVGLEPVYLEKHSSRGYYSLFADRLAKLAKKQESLEQRSSSMSNAAVRSARNINAERALKDFTTLSDFMTKVLAPRRERQMARAIDSGNVGVVIVGAAHARELGRRFGVRPLYLPPNIKRAAIKARLQIKLAQAIRAIQKKYRKITRRVPFPQKCLKS